jgi:hypothetical protein
MCFNLMIIIYILVSVFYLYSHDVIFIDSSVDLELITITFIAY